MDNIEVMNHFAEANKVQKEMGIIYLTPPRYPGLISTYGADKTNAHKMPWTAAMPLKAGCVALFCFCVVLHDWLLCWWLMPHGTPS